MWSVTCFESRSTQEGERPIEQRSRFYFGKPWDLTFELSLSEWVRVHEMEKAELAVLGCWSFDFYCVLHSKTLALIPAVSKIEENGTYDSVGFSSHFHPLQGHITCFWCFITFLLLANKLILSVAGRAPYHPPLTVYLLPAPQHCSSDLISTHDILLMGCVICSKLNSLPFFLPLWLN